MSLVGFDHDMKVCHKLVNSIFFAISVCRQVLISKCKSSFYFFNLLYFYYLKLKGGKNKEAGLLSAQ